MKIERASIFDCSNITNLWHKMYMEMNVEDMQVEAFMFGLTQKVYDPSYSIFILGKKEGFILGYLSTEPYSGKLVGSCENLYVNQRYRGKNYNDLLIDALRDDLIKKGMQIEEFITLNNESLIRYYNRKGYKPERIIFRKEVPSGV